jgi:hypothetical protein
MMLEAVCLGQQLPTNPSIQLPLPINTIELKRDQTIVGVVPSFGYYGPVKCDNNGNIYFRLSEMGLNHSPILKVSAKGEKKAEFTVPHDFVSPKEYFAIYDYAVDFDGVVYLLGSTGREQYLLQFSDDGKYQNQVKLELPTSVEVENVAVFRSGEIFVTGHHSSDGEEKLAKHGYAAVLKSDGSLQKLVSTNYASGKPEENFDSLKLNSGYALPGIDGNIYNLRANRILVISPGGEIQRTILVSAPAGDYSPQKLAISGGILSVEWATVAKNHKVLPLFRTYSSDGELLREYVPSPELKNSPLCFSMEDGYTFSGNQNGTMTIMHASIK